MMKTQDTPTTALTTENMFRLLHLAPEFHSNFQVSGKNVTSYKLTDTETSRESYGVVVTTPDTNLVINLLLYISSEEILEEVLTALKSCKDTECIDDILDRFIYYV